MLYASARLALAAPRRVIALAVLAMIGAAIFGIPVSKTLLPGDWFDPGSESSQASALLSRKFGQGDIVMLITVTSSGGAEGPRARAVGTDLAV